MPSHSSFLDISALFEQCEQSSLLKGAQLAKSGAVRKLTITGHTVKAEVKGSQLYRVFIACNLLAVKFPLAAALALRRTIKRYANTPWLLPSAYSISKHRMKTVNVSRSAVI